ncbi:MAG TPA: TauD/TfdA family dioxygenase [Acetobacteraceae bacterium]|nr:TauD/TfdA family dioxygenase [Acetobacteraceae bacterium]
MMDGIAPLAARLQPVSGRNVWYGPEMARRQDWIRPLTAAEIAALDSAVARLDASGIAIEAIDASQMESPVLRALVDEIRHAVLHDTGFILLRGVPVERWTTRQCAIAYFGLGTIIGEPVSQNAMGHILGHVKDIGFDYHRPTHRGYQTAARLPYHCDSSDIVALLCLKPSRSGGLSSIVSSGALYNEMLRRDPALVAALCCPVYRDRRGEVPAGADPWYAVPVFNPMPDGSLVTTYVRSSILKAQRFPEVPRVTPELDAACNLLDSLAESGEIHLDMEFRPGDIQFLNNHWILHSRTAFEDFAEPERRRHLFRLWLACADGPKLPEVFTRVWQGETANGRPAGIRVPGVPLTAPLDAV